MTERSLLRSVLDFVLEKNLQDDLFNYVSKDDKECLEEIMGKQNLSEEVKE